MAEASVIDPSRISNGTATHLERFITYALAICAHTGLDRIIPCSSDVTLPPPPPGRHLITSNLFNSEAVLPNYVVQVGSSRAAGGQLAGSWGGAGGQLGGSWWVAGG